MGGVPPQVAVRALIAWTQLFGMVSFELFGHFVNVVNDNAEFFDQAMRLVGGFAGLKGLGTDPRRRTCGGSVPAGIELPPEQKPA